MLKMKEPPKPRKLSRVTHPIVQTLRLERYRRGISGVDLAETMGYSVKALHEWEQGVNNPKLTHLQDWSQSLGFKIVLVKE